MTLIYLTPFRCYRAILVDAAMRMSIEPQARILARFLKVLPEWQANTDTTGARKCDPSPLDRGNQGTILVTRLSFSGG